MSRKIHSWLTFIQKPVNHAHRFVYFLEMLLQYLFYFCSNLWSFRFYQADYIMISDHRNRESFYQWNIPYLSICVRLYCKYVLYLYRFTHKAHLNNICNSVWLDFLFTFLKRNSKSVAPQLESYMDEKFIIRAFSTMGEQVVSVRILRNKMTGWEPQKPAAVNFTVILFSY